MKYILKAIYGLLLGAYLIHGVAYAAPGDFDTSFNSPHGFATYQDGRGYEVSLQEDEKIVVAGVSDGDILILRYNSNGTLDSTFGTDGVVTYDSGYSDFVSAIDIQADGKIVVVDNVTDSPLIDDLLILRYNTNGTLDSTFGEGGVVTYQSVDGSAIDIQADGKIVVVADSDDILILRYNNDGTLDSTFGEGGVVTYDSGYADDGSAIEIQTDGKIVVVGNITYYYSGFFPSSTSIDVLILRYNSNGTLDSTFGTDGVVIFDNRMSDIGLALAIQPDGKIVVAGTLAESIFYDVLLLRYNSNGTLDSTFGEGGVVIYDSGSCCEDGKSVSIQADGKIVIAGRQILRFNNNGTLDNTFGVDGVVDFERAITALSIQADGKIVVVGYCECVFVARLLGQETQLIPTSKQSFFYPAVSTRIMNMNPSIAKPVGVGSVAHGGDSLDINMGLFRFSGLIDIYGAYSVSTDPQTVNVLNPNGSSFTSFTMSEIENALSTGVPPVGAQPWKTNTTGSISVNLLGSIPISTLLSGTYTAYLLVTPTGNLNSYYLWITSFEVP
jgi:uncharacterized delta-60 repeat protein